MKLASIIEHYQDALYARYGAQITPEQEHALGAILDCRTARYGERVLNTATPATNNTAFIPAAIG